MSQRQLRGTVRARGEEAVGELQHRTQVKPREAGLMEASVLANATPNIQPWSGRYGGRERQDIDHSYSKRSLWVRASGRAEGSETRPSEAQGEVGSPHISDEAGESQWSKGGDGLKSAEPRQLTFVFADSPQGDKDRGPQDESRGKRFLVHTAKGNGRMEPATCTAAAKSERSMESVASAAQSGAGVAERVAKQRSARRRRAECGASGR